MLVFVEEGKPENQEPGRLLKFLDLYSNLYRWTEIFLFSRYQFAQLIQLQKRLGKADFPLVEQAYYPNYKEMVSVEKIIY